MQDRNEKLILKNKMHFMITAFEKDLRELLETNLETDDLPKDLYNKATERNLSADDVKSLLAELDLADYLRLINIHNEKLKITPADLNFINKYCNNDFIAIRNRVMHSKEPEFNDFSIVENTYKNIPDYVFSISWINIINSYKIYMSDSSYFTDKYSEISKQKNTVIHNIPKLYCDEVEFIGRKEELYKLKELMNNQTKPIISVIGEGGVGKTALVLKLLNDYLKDNNSPFEIILWVSFKMTTLEGISFVEIDDSIKSISGMYNEINDFIGGKTLSSADELIELSKQFKTLLVLDNLETINASELKNFFYLFSNHGKILTTSRIGVNEQEVRFLLQGLSHNDVIAYTSELLEYYKLTNLFVGSKDRVRFAEKLFNNPLVIKWAIRSLNCGEKLSNIYDNIIDAVNFCMSNVYDKLSDLSKRILQIISILNHQVCYGSLFFYLNFKVTQGDELRKSLNEIDKACFFNKSELEKGFYTLTPQAKNFIDNNDLVDTGTKTYIDNKRKQLNQIDQELENMAKYSPFDLFTVYIDYSSESNKIASYFLSLALLKSKDDNVKDALDYVSLAKSLSPDFYECYRVSAIINGMNKEAISLSEFENALQKCNTNLQTAIVLYSYSEFMLRLSSDREKAMRLIERADLVTPNQKAILLQKVKILTYKGEYDSALEVCEHVRSLIVDKVEDIKVINILQTRIADIYRRKAEQFQQPSLAMQRFELLKKAFSFLEFDGICDIDVYAMQCRILKELCFLATDESMDYIFSKLSSNYYNLKQCKDMFAIFMTKLNCEIKENFPHKKNKFRRYYSEQLDNVVAPDDPDKGIIFRLFNNYGFLKSKICEQNIYFKHNNEFRLGDVVRFELSLTDGKMQATKIMKTN